ncbi:hypothetical protein CRUP_016597 [Coryphaenoides rupestris]|nr:hypothetical protein CRUP_016597 [Coryphaenoides rupestris]
MNSDPKKPLVLSFHGWAGTGKNFASKLIADNIYKKGMDSKFVHFFNAELHFPDKGRIETYKRWITGNVTDCAHSMFIFDEMDKMHPGLIDTIKPFVDHHKLDGVSYRKAIFIFLGNAGGEIITRTTLEFLKEGETREELKLKDIEVALSLGNVTDCAHSMFIFDEMDKMHPGLIDTINAVCGLPPQAGWRVVPESHLHLPRKCWGRNHHENNFGIPEGRENQRGTQAEGHRSGWWHATLIEKHLVDYFVPFLPLEYRHVVQCVMAEMKVKGRQPNLEIAHRVASDVSYYPKVDPVFSDSGCKKIASRLNFF